MKLLKPKPNKKLAIVSSVIVLGLIGGVSAEMTNQHKAGADTSPLVTEVDHQNDRLDNHEARISNLEGDTKDLQNKTNTPPSSTRTVVPTVRAVTAPSGATTGTSSASAPDSAAPTVVSFREIPLDPDNSDCEYTYSDGTVKRFPWKTTVAQGSWITDGNGQNGHWVKAVQTSGYCDNRAIGMPKN